MPLYRSRAFLMAVGVAIGEMLAEEEHVHLVCPYHIADEQIVCPLIAILARLLRRPAGFDEETLGELERIVEMTGAREVASTHPRCRCSGSTMYRTSELESCTRISTSSSRSSPNSRST